MISLNPHINFNGNAKEAFEFYKSILGGEITKIIHFRDLASESFQVPEEEADKIMHIELEIKENTFLMGNDVPSFMGRTNEMENRSKIFVRAETKEEAENFFSRLSVGGQVEGPMSESPWGTHAAMFRDKYGIEWIIEFSENK